MHMNYNTVMVTDVILFEDMIALISKSWAQRQQQQLAQALFSSVEKSCAKRTSHE